LLALRFKFKPFEAIFCSLPTREVNALKITGMAITDNPAIKEAGIKLSENCDQDEFCILEINLSNFEQSAVDTNSKTSLDLKPK
jgi:hypothetical protein